MNFTTGIFLSAGSANTTLKNNIATANSFGIYLSSSSKNTLQNNVANSNAFAFGQFSGTGIALDSSSNNFLKNNTADSNDVAGIALFNGSGNNTLKGNTADSNNDTGIVVSNSNDNDLKSNTADSNQSAGIYIDNAANNNFKNNTADDNGSYGFAVNDTDNTFKNNKCSGNISGGSSPSDFCKSRNNAPIHLRGLVQSGGTGNILALKDARVTLYEATGGKPRVVGRGRTDKTGSFLITSTGRTSDSVFYLTADLGRGTILIAMLGPALPTHAIVNELTTVAFTYSGAQFIDKGSLGGDAFGLRIAAGMNNNLVAVLSGRSSSVLLSSPNADETNALRSTRALANLLAACVRNGRVDCEALFDLASPSGGPRPTDTAGALLDIAHHPANNVEGIYQQSKVLEIYTPSLENRPDAWTLAVKVNDSGDDNFLFGGTRQRRLRRPWLCLDCQQRGTRDHRVHRPFDRSQARR